MLDVIDLIHSLPAMSDDNASQGGNPLLNGINCHIKKGQSVAIVGASGSGKTTLLGFLAGLDTPKQGKVLIDDINIAALDEEGRAAVRAQYVAFVFQSFQLIDGLTALQNVCLPLEVKDESAPQKKAKKWLERVGLGHRIHHNPKTLSGGEQQRVALARAFACASPILFADEPTGSLDTQTGEQIADLLFQLASEQQQTLILVTHDLKLAKRCERILTLKNGVLSETY